MTVKTQIEQDLKAALLSGDRQKATVLRGLKGAILNTEIAQGKRQEGLEDQAILQLLSKEAKSRQESADIYTKNNAQQRADQELAEKAIIESYLPAQLEDAELKQIIDETAQATNSNTMADMGKLIGAVKGKVGSQADGSRIARLVKERLSV